MPREAEVDVTANFRNQTSDTNFVPEVDATGNFGHRTLYTNFVAEVDATTNFGHRTLDTNSVALLSQCNGGLSLAPSNGIEGTNRCPTYDHT